MEGLFFLETLLGLISIILLIIGGYYILRIRYLSNDFRNVWDYSFFAICSIVLAIGVNLSLHLARVNINSDTLKLILSTILFISSVFVVLAASKMYHLFDHINGRKLLRNMRK